MADANDSMHSDFETSLREVQALSDEELFDRLKSQGRDIGPVVESTRKLYQKQLATLLASPEKRGTTPLANGTNGTAEHNGDDGTDSDESIGNSSRASHASRGSSVPKKVGVGRRSATRTPQKATPEVFADAEEVAASKPKTRFSTSTYTPPKSPRTFEEYVAESEARKGKSFNDGSSFGEVEPAPGSGNMKLLLVLAVLALIAAYFFLVYKNIKPDQDTVIEEEIDALRQRFMEEESATQVPN